jgi:SAM-dependent methyltransferase
MSGVTRGAAVQPAPCCVCGGEQFRRVFEKDDLEYFRCRVCDLVVALPLPTAADAERFYDDDYVEGGGAALAAEETMMRATARYRLGKVRVHLRGRRLLDVGCSTGALLEEAFDAGLEADGIDLSRTAVDRARGKGHTARVATVESLTGVTYDAVTAFDVIEHVLDPSSFLQSAHGLLPPGGVLALTTPNTNSLTSRAMGRRWYFYLPTVHTFHFNPGNITALLSSRGFDVLEISRASKALTYDYSLIAFEGSNPLVSRTWRLLGSMIPASWHDRVFRVPIGEMLVIARKR